MHKIKESLFEKMYTTFWFAVNSNNRLSWIIKWPRAYPEIVVAGDDGVWEQSPQQGLGAEPPVEFEGQSIQKLNTFAYLTLIVNFACKFARVLNIRKSQSTSYCYKRPWSMHPGRGALKMQDLENDGPMWTWIWGTGKCNTWKIEDRIKTFQPTTDYWNECIQAPI